MRIPIVFFAFLLTGCISVPTSTEPRFYMLQALDKSEVKNHYQIASGTVIAVGPVRIPHYLDRPQIVSQNKNTTLEFAQFDRWGEPLNQSFKRVISEDLSLMLPEADIEKYPYNSLIPVKYQVIFEVLEMKNDINGETSLSVQWSIIDVKYNKVMVNKKSLFSRPVDPKDYQGLVKAINAECVLLSDEVAASLASLEVKS